MDKLEIMAPAGNMECLLAAIEGGADSVYFGIGRLNMRSQSANNFTPESLPEVVRICRSYGVKTYLTLNITLYGEDLAPARAVLEAAKEAGVDAVIASDMAAILCCRELGIPVHISTQLSISNLEALRFYAQFADVVVLARELNLDQVKAIVLRCSRTAPSVWRFPENATFRWRPMGNRPTGAPVCRYAAAATASPTWKPASN